jgi:hypothetical protein
MIVGTNRVNAQVVLDALARQTCPDAVVELVVFDCAALSNPALETAVSCSPTTAAGSSPRVVADRQRGGLRVAGVAVHSVSRSVTLRNSC